MVGHRRPPSHGTPRLPPEYPPPLLAMAVLSGSGPTAPPSAHRLGPRRRGHCSPQSASSRPLLPPRGQTIGRRGLGSTRTSLRQWCALLLLLRAPGPATAPLPPDPHQWQQQQQQGQRWRQILLRSTRSTRRLQICRPRLHLHQHPPSLWASLRAPPPASRGSGAVLVQARSRLKWRLMRGGWPPSQLPRCCRRSQVR